MHKRLIPLFVTVILLLTAHVSYGEDISFEASVDRTTVEVGSFCQLTLTFSGTESVSPRELPPIDGLQIRYLGPNTRVSIMNGQISRSIAFMYNIYPEKIGQFQIPSLSISIDGKEYKTQPINLQAVNAAAPPPARTQNPSDDLTSLQDKIFVTMQTPRNQVYLNERIPLSVKLFVSGLNIRNIQYPEFEHTGFTVDDYQEPKRYQEMIGGIRYEVIEFKTFIYPTRTGDLTLGPGRQICQVLFKRAGRRRQSFGGFGDLFDDDFFNGFFNSYDSRSVTLSSADLKIKVFPLPEEGKPGDFSGAVGQFQFDATVSPRDIKVGDPITVRMTISGDGNLKAVTMPSIPDGQKDFKRYDPQINDQGGAKVLEQVIIPTTEKVKELPAIRFSYFDVQSQEYKTIPKGPFPLKVTPLEEGEELRVVGLGKQVGAMIMPEESLGRDIVFIKDRPGYFQPAGFLLYKSFWFVVMLVLTGVVWAGLLITYHITHKLKTDVQFARRMQAPRRARKGLLQAKNLIRKGGHQPFYDALFKTLQRYFVHKFHMPSGTITLDAIIDIVKTKGMKTEVLEYIKSVFEECEMSRYASVQLGEDKMHDSFHRTEKIIDFFERNWR